VSAGAFNENQPTESVIWTISWVLAPENVESQDMNKKRKLRVGDWVEVRTKEEILRTLDSNGCLDGMPFMPEMFQFCSKRFQVYKRAHKTCDYSTQSPYRTRWLRNTVHLETRCDGHAHDGCQAGCLLYWKLSWLKPLGDNARGAELSAESTHGKANLGCEESDIWKHTHLPDSAGEARTYICQVTEIPRATTYLAWWDVRQYFEDYWSGNVGLGRIFSALIYSAYYHLSQAGIGVGGAMRWCYDKFHPWFGGTRFPRNPGQIPAGQPTPTVTLNLQPGELVRVKSHEEILKTLDTRNKNRGMFWDAELVPYCGKTFRVLRRLSKNIDEKTSKMVEMKSPCIVLESVVCQARYSDCRLLCPKSMYPYWREIWLERVSPEGSPVADEAKVAEGSGLQPELVSVATGETRFPEPKEPEQPKAQLPTDDAMRPDGELAEYERP
jgi:hypothetical protein